ncbi:DUF1654 domain-containing protein [Billgrantia endophytica]|uniref:DUF1654 domain-containing protein n=1 Tax=Billgrantia endophytica TaxID=2033802 RepID=A0A2N7TX48_9GAMM|nr:DUF1654 domain-containing protein [Halomonas endophytica]PMR72764.1 hypothetical protein C1H69_20170 [Halomonas endophytica]
MAKKQRTSSFEPLANRIRAQINSPRAQVENTTTISREPDERGDDWDRLLDEIGTMDEVTMVAMEDGSVELRWSAPESAE